MNSLANPHKWYISGAVSAGAIMATIDMFILFVATPHLRGIFSATVAEISWISISYAVATMVVMPLSGWLCQVHGIKKVYQAGIIIFIISSALCATANSLDTLVVYRIFQGIGAGILLPVEQLILRRTFPPEEHGIATGIYGTTIMVGPALGPVLGGHIIDNYHWSYMFLINIPIGLIGLFMVNQFVPDYSKLEKENLKAEPAAQTAIPKNTKKLKPDWFGITLLTLTMFTLVWFLERGERTYWFENDFNCLLLFTSIASFLMFCTHELTTSHPAVDLRVMRNKVFSTAMLMYFILGFIVAATLFILPIYMQEILGFTATKAGAALAPRAILMMFLFPIVGMLLSRVAPKVFIYLGLTLGFISAAMMSLFTHETGINDIILPNYLQGAAVALILTPLGAVAFRHLKQEELAPAAGLDAISRQLGSVLGIAVFAALLNTFQLEAWGNAIHHINMNYSVLFERFGGVIQFFQGRNLVDPVTAELQALWALNGRVEEQINVLSYMRLFQWTALLFVFMLMVTVFTKLKPNVDKTIHNKNPSIIKSKNKTALLPQEHQEVSSKVA